MIATGIILLAGVILSAAAAWVGYKDNSEHKTDHAFTWFTLCGTLATLLRIIVVVFCQHSSWWTHHVPYDYLQGLPVVVFVAYFSNDPLLFPGGAQLAFFTLICAAVITALLVLGGWVIWPFWLLCWVIHWLMHRFKKPG